MGFSRCLLHEVLFALLFFATVANASAIASYASKAESVREAVGPCKSIVTFNTGFPVASCPDNEKTNFLRHNNDTSNGLPGIFQADSSRTNDTLVQVSDSLEFKDDVFQEPAMLPFSGSHPVRQYSISRLITSFQKDSLIESWDIYISWRDTISMTSDGKSESGVVYSFPGDSSVHEVVSENEELVAEQSEGDNLIDAVKGQEFTDSLTTASNEKLGYHFHVQVAASRRALDDSKIKKIFDGEMEVVHRLEEGWHKYQIYAGGNYVEAINMLRSVKVDGAFIVVYNRENEKLKLWKTVLQQRREMVQFRVQIAASKKRLGKKVLDNIYSGNFPVHEIEEEGWYKYQINLGNDYKEAREKEKLIDVKGLFMVPYLGGQKTNLYKFLRLYWY